MTLVIKQEALDGAQGWSPKCSSVMVPLRLLWASMLTGFLQDTLVFGGDNADAILL